MFGRLLLLFTLVPVLELYLLVQIGGEIGTVNTIAIVIVTGILGAAFAKSQGAQIIRKIQTTWGAGQVPGKELVHGALILAGGITLLTPGFVTDIIGLTLLFPVTRILYAKWLYSYFQKKISKGQWSYSSTSAGPQDSPGNTRDFYDPNEKIIDAEVVDEKKDGR